MTGSPSGPQSLEGLDAYVVTAEVHGPLAKVLTVEPLPAGLLPPHDTVISLLTFTVSDDVSEEVHVPELPCHTGIAEAEAGGGSLGHSGICGYGWDREGHPRDEDPCSAITPARFVSAGHPTHLGIVLYPRTDQGEAQAGRYSVRVPLDETSTLALVYNLRPHDPAPVEWPAVETTLIVSGEEMLPTRLPFACHPGSGGWSRCSRTPTTSSCAAPTGRSMSCSHQATSG